MAILPFRQVHLDFHTSPFIGGVGEDFDADEFVRTLRAAAVNSITVFARCHHGMCYYPSKVAPQHPALKRDLLGEMIEACHSHGIQAPIYTTVVWDEHVAGAHPEWRQVDAHGALVGRPALSGGGGWKWLCMNTPYVDYLAAHIEEVCRLYPVDGLFVDIVMQHSPGCVCEYCLVSMSKLGLDAESPADLERHSLIVSRNLMRRITDLVHGIHPSARLFYNSRLRLDRLPERGVRGEAEFYTHWEIESLPSGGWGYDHFPLWAHHYQTLEKEMLGMTGRFHLSWADFGGLKTRAALEYECFRHLSRGAGNSIGDQLHPRGRLDSAVYDLIGSVYTQVEAVEPWCADARPLADIGVMIPGVFPRHGESRTRDSLEGAMHMLSELGCQFQIIDQEQDLNPYRLLILPDDTMVAPQLAARVKAFIAKGGALIASHRSGLKPDESGFALDDLGLEYHGPGMFTPNYFHLTGDSGDIAYGLAVTDHVMYEAGSQVKLRRGTAMLVEEGVPYFNRTWQRFSSHHQTPFEKTSGFPMITRRKRAIYFASPIFRAYRVYGALAYKTLFRNAVNALLPDPLVQSSLPSTAEVTVLAQPAGDGRRLVCHLLHYTPQRRASRLDIIEDILPLHDISLAVRTGDKPGRVYLAPQKTDLAFSYGGGVTRCTVPVVRGHQIIVFE